LGLDAGARPCKLAFMNSGTRRNLKASDAPTQQAHLSCLTRRSFLHAVGLTSAALSLPEASRAQDKVIQGLEKTQTDTHAKDWKPVSDRKIRVGLAGYGVCKRGILSLHRHLH
jgi:hypothetical protein